MIKLIAKLVVFIETLDGATAIEYGLLAGGISLAVVAAVFAFGTDLRSVFNAADLAMQSVSNNAAANSGS